MKNKLCLLLCGVITLSLLSGCAPKGDTGLTVLEVSEVTHSVFYAPQYAAINLGFFEEEGLQINLTNAGGADKVMASLLSGSADIGFAGPEAAVYVYLEGKEDYAKIFAQVTRCDGSFLVGRHPAQNFDWQDLKGKTVLPGRKGGVPYMTFEHVLRQNGLQPGVDVYFDDSVAFNNMAAAFAAGEGDYVTMFEPTASSFEEQGQGYVAASVGAESGEIPYTAYFANKSYIEQNPGIIEKFTRALYRGQQWVQSHSAGEIASVLAPSFADTDISLLEKSIERYKSINAWNATPAMSKQAFDNLQAIMKSAGELSREAEYEALVDNSFADMAAKLQ